MANANVARGLIPYRHATGEPYTGAGSIYYVPAADVNNIFPGDPVALVDNGADGNGIPRVTIGLAGPGQFIIGAMVGIVAGGDPVVPVTRDLPVYRQASVLQYILVADDPDLAFVVQDDGVGGGLAQGAPARNANLVAGAGSTVTGYSGWQLSSASLGVANNLQLRVLRMLQQADNAIGANAKWLVTINLHSLRNNTGV